MRILAAFLMLMSSAFAQTYVNGVPNQTIQQGQVFYSQSGDTIASIEAECSSSCTYVVTTSQTFTLTANHTLSSNVRVNFQAGGLWTVNGAFTLTMSSNVSGTVSQHFAGTSTIAGLTGQVPVEWFGAVGDGTIVLGGSGTDNTTAIQKTISAIISGCALIGPHTYKITAALTVTASFDGVCGTYFGYPSVGTTSSVITQTSASADFIDFTGYFDTATNLILQRVVLPTGTATGLSFNTGGGHTVTNISSQDSIRGFYYHGTSSFGVGINQSLAVGWGFSVVTTYTTQSLYGHYMDSADGVAENTILFKDGQVAANPSNVGSAVSYGYYIHGTAVNDVDMYGVGSSNISHSLYVDYSGSGASDSAADIHLHFPIFDSCLVDCVFVNNLLPAGSASVTVDAGYLETNTASAKIVHIEGSDGVSISNNQIFDIAGTTGAIGVYANASHDISVVNNKIQNLNAGTGISFVGTVNGVITGNTGSGTSAQPWTTGISLTSTSTNNAISGNSLSGNMTTGMSFDGTSLTNDVGINAINPANITTPISGVPTGTSPSFLATGSKLNGSLICSATNGACDYRNLTGAVTASGCTVSGAICTVGTATATVTFSVIPGTFTHLKLMVNGRCDAASTLNSGIYMQLNGDTGANYSTNILSAQSTTIASASFTSSANAPLGVISCTTAPTNDTGEVTIALPFYAGTAFLKKGTVENVAAGNTTISATFVEHWHDGWFWNSTAAITSITLGVSGGSNFVAGSTFTLEGFN